MDKMKRLSLLQESLNKSRSALLLWLGDTELMGDESAEELLAAHDLIQKIQGDILVHNNLGRYFIKKVRE